MNALDVGVKFGSVSLGQDTARVSLSIGRERMNIDSADGFFCNRRLVGSIILGHADDAPGQSSFLDDDDHRVSGAFDVKGFRVGSNRINAGLTFSLNDVDVSELARFSKGEGRLIVGEVVDIPAPEPKSRQSEGARTQSNGSLATDQPWREVRIDTLGLSAGIVKSLAEADINTIGDLSDYQHGDNLLTKIPGIGAGKGQQIEDVLMKFWADNPDSGKE